MRLVTPSTPSVSLRSLSRRTPEKPLRCTHCQHIRCKSPARPTPPLQTARATHLSAALGPSAGLGHRTADRRQPTAYRQSYVLPADSGRPTPALRGVPEQVTLTRTTHRSRFDVRSDRDNRSVAGPACEDNGKNRRGSESIRFRPRLGSTQRSLQIGHPALRKDFVLRHRVLELNQEVNTRFCLARSLEHSSSQLGITIQSTEETFQGPLLRDPGIQYEMPPEFSFVPTVDLQEPNCHPGEESRRIGTDQIWVKKRQSRFNA